ncbi:hypothetical protein PIB30_079324 [Stylosanthes scabra]|uniref:Uncharacterized protein n=1 Tax=Stylosanthes scabra TaxID=79078 RepID=A0ABU6TRH5_9FABA|nr:hypothetical protein [Stylosanthes scabra]
MNGQGWDPSQIGYHSDNSSDGYFSCEDSLPACQIDNDEFQHRARFEAMCIHMIKAKFGAEVAKESARNKKIAKKSLKAKSRAYVYAPKGPIRTYCHALGITS